MATKNNCLSFNKNQGSFVDCTSNDAKKYSNFNLNHASKTGSDTSSFVQFQSKSKSKETFATSTDLKVSQSYENSKKSLINSSIAESRQNIFESFNEEKSKNQQWKKNDGINSSNLNKSTLSLHISAYENSTVSFPEEATTTTTDSFDENKMVQMKSSAKKQKKNAKQIFNGFMPSVAQSSFEVPRQQGEEIMSPEVMQFKASQRLLNPPRESGGTAESKKEKIKPFILTEKEKMGASSATATSSTFFGIILSFIHIWICIPLIVKQFNGLIGKSKERLIIKFPLVNERIFFGGLKDIPSTSSTSSSNNGDNSLENVELIVHRPIWFCWRMWLDRKMGLGEGFMEGDWDCIPSSKALLTLLIRARRDNSSPLSAKSAPKTKTLFDCVYSIFGDSVRSLVFSLNYLQHKWRTNTLIQSQKNIREHYDLGNDMFELFLDESMTYSSAVFKEPLPTNITKSDFQLLFDAQMRKYDALCDRLNIQSTDHVLEIGCGWGHCAIRAVKRFGCKWTGLTISEQQFALCKNRVKEAGLEDKIDIKFLDYRKETGIYDKIISIEMIEAVGNEYFGVYFSTINDRLRSGGIAAIQAIYCNDDQYERLIKSSDFIKKHIFPGGDMPSIGIMNASCPKGLTMSKEILQLEKHYSVTLDLWNAAWQERRQKILSLGYSDRFIRKWEFYFVLCSALFDYGNIHVGQFSFIKK